jgi:hypothetical protein
LLKKKVSHLHQEDDALPALNPHSLFLTASQHTH